MTPNEAIRFGLNLNRDGQRRTAFNLLSYPEIDMKRLTAIWPELNEIPTPLVERLETDARYAVYLDRQQSDVAVLRREEGRAIPQTMDFGRIPGLSNELKQKLAQRKPTSIAEAQRIDGMTPAALAIIIATIQHLNNERGAA